MLSKAFTLSVIFVVCCSVVGLGYVIHFLYRRHWDAQKSQEVAQELSSVTNAANVFFDQNLLPPSDIEGFLRAVPTGFIRVRTGEDPWGSPYFYQVITEVVGPTTKFTIVMRSLGPNRTDENGGGDDIQRTSVERFLTE